VLYRLVKLTRRIRILLGGYKEMEEKHFLFNPPNALTVRDVRRRLIPLGYQYNFVSTTYRRQRWTARKLVDDEHQIHLRFYGPREDSVDTVSGHYELDPMIRPMEHLGGDELRSLTAEESQEIRVALTQSS
jgi:hypothetical protein